MIKKNLLKAAMITALTLTMLTACSKNTATVPETQPQSETTTVEQSGESLVGTETEKEKTEKETKEDSSSVVETTTEEVTAEETTTEPETTTEAHVHSYTSSITTEASCSVEGVMTFTCECGDTYTESIEKTAHSFGAYTYNNDATEDADGTETAVCSVCGTSDTRTAAGTKLEHVHSYTSSITAEASCATEGVMTYTCKCGDSYTEAIPKTEHKFGEYVYNGDANARYDGTETATCSVCGASDTRTKEGTKIVYGDPSQSFFDWMKENCNPYGLECLYAQEGFTETFPFVDDVSDTQYIVHYLEGGDSSPVDEFRRTHNMSIWGEHTYCMGQFKEGIVWVTDFGRNSY